ncbi:NUDIX hydrolase domain-like protein [Phaeosphaeria sp. MPI-PUGE-AT-0046c]|nr:NUDIX hydrolase domain-like protein [Phaeosphaeria sp. MPI-PUGE-AT-0046c]
MRSTAWLAQSKAITTMALSQSSLQALARLRAYKPPPTQWYNCPLSRRAAVLILLFPDRHGDLKVVLTMRSAALNTYAGQVAFAGGKADTLEESPWDTARREAYEEIGLPLDEDKLKDWSIEHLCELPTNLAKTELGVRPCVAYLSPSPSQTTSSSPSSSNDERAADVESRLIPRLDPKEVAAVFTAPFHAFLRKSWTGEGPGPVQKDGRPEKWYRGSWTDWHESRWRMHNFYMPKPVGENKSRTIAEKGEQGDGTSALDKTTVFRIFGMTARIIVDAARVAYNEEPEFEHNSHHGDEDLIARLLRMGRLSEVRKKGEVLTKEVIREASKI